jgi:hypothetical protein
MKKKKSATRGAVKRRAAGRTGSTASTVGRMSLRDYFAGQVLASFAANVEAGRLLHGSRSVLATYSYDLADAMLQARKP